MKAPLFIIMDAHHYHVIQLPLGAGVISDIALPSEYVGFSWDDCDPCQ